MKRATGFVSHPDCAGHDTGPGHPERPGRLDALNEAASELERELGERFARIEARHAAEGEIALAHPESHVGLIREAAWRAEDGDVFVAIDADTIISPGSWNAGLAAAGSVLTAIDAVVAGELANAFCAVRPPGHHATADRAMGFCLFNNVAIGARYARGLGLERALIVDWDVHHGNGTEAIFYDDASVFYLSMHQFPHYPGTGHREDTGFGEGGGATLNIPLPPGLPPERYVSELEDGIDAALADLTPDIILISAGFDAAYGDTLAGFTLRPEDYTELTRHLMRAADRHCGGKLVSVLEGGYNLDMLRVCAGAHIRALAGS